MQKVAETKIGILLRVFTGANYASTSGKRFWVPYYEWMVLIWYTKFIKMHEEWKAVYNDVVARKDDC